MLKILSPYLSHFLNMLKLLHLHNNIFIIIFNIKMLKFNYNIQPILLIPSAIILNIGAEVLEPELPFSHNTTIVYSGFFAG